MDTAEPDSAVLLPLVQVMQQQGGGKELCSWGL